MGSSGGSSARCAECGAALAASHRYCLECGARRGPLPAVVARRLEALIERAREAEDRRMVARTRAAIVATQGGVAAEEGADAEEERDAWGFMPSPQVAGIAVMALLAAGVILGSVTNPFAQGAGAASIVLEVAEPPQEAAEESLAETPPARPVAEAPLSAPIAEVPAAAPLEESTEPEAPPATELPPELPEEETLPEIKHVFLIVLDGHGYEEAFGSGSPVPYLAETLAGEGKLLANYYAVAQGGLANEIALLSGQGPTPQTVLNCPERTPISPGDLSAEGQVEGEGCVYPSETKTLPEQLVEAKLTWRAYLEPGPIQAWRDPLSFFAEMADGEIAPEHGDLERLAADLKDGKTTPSFSYIVPNACHDGGEEPCEPEKPAGLTAGEEFLETVVPEITASAAFQEGGLLAITFDQASKPGGEPEADSCCATPEYPNLPPPATSAEPSAPGPVEPTGGGGQVGMLLLSPYVAAGTVEEATYYNHFAFLRSVEELFGLEPLGYAAEPALTAFEPGVVFDASPEESTAAVPAG
jgi:phosphatidylinositol-3-phosphatase